MTNRFKTRCCFRQARRPQLSALDSSPPSPRCCPKPLACSPQPTSLGLQSPALTPQPKAPPPQAVGSGHNPASPQQLTLVTRSAPSVPSPLIRDSKAATVSAEKTIPDWLMRAGSFHSIHKMKGLSFEEKNTLFLRLYLLPSLRGKP